MFWCDPGIFWKNSKITIWSSDKDTLSSSTPRARPSNRDKLPMTAQATTTDCWFVDWYWCLMIPLGGSIVIILFSAFLSYWHYRLGFRWELCSNCRLIGAAKQAFYKLKHQVENKQHLTALQTQSFILLDMTCIKADECLGWNPWKTKVNVLFLSFNISELQHCSIVGHVLQWKFDLKIKK